MSNAAAIIDIYMLMQSMTNIYVKKLGTAVMLMGQNKEIQLMLSEQA